VSTQVGMHTGIARSAGTRWAHRIIAVGAVTAACLVVAPGVASARPHAPSDSQIRSAQAAKAEAASQVGAITAALATAQASVDAARADANIALDTFQGKQAEYETAQAAADVAAAAAKKAEADLGVARDDVAAFARSSYMQGSTSPTFAALMTADGPAQLIQRQALLESAGGHRSDVLVKVAVVQQRTAASKAAAATALAHADTLKKEAAKALTAASNVEAGARQKAAAVQAQQSALQAKLQKAQRTLLGLQGARAAAARYDAQQAAAARAAEAAARAAAEAPSEGSSDSSGSNNPPPVQSAGPPAGAGSSSAAQTAINAAMRYIGTRYAWGGGSLSGPSEGWGIDAGVVGFDCSGLTRYAYAQAGIYIARNSSAQYSTLPKVSSSNLRPGDLVFYATNTSRPSTIHHVAMYLGGGRMIEAPESGKTVRVTSMRWGGFIGAVRPSA
jgi:cell wall-associated NlpC family hydrolase